MSLPLPNLDDRQFEDLLEEMRVKIPRYAPDWTNHNLSDPGITLLEMLAWLSEMVIYRLNQVPAAHYEKFMKLIGEKEDNLTKAVEKLWKPYRAITAADFETLAAAADPDKVARAKAFVNRNLEYFTYESPGHISIAVVPKTDTPEQKPILNQEMRDAILNNLLPRRLITTRVHVLGPGYLDAAVRFTIKPKANVDIQLLEPKVREALRLFLHPIYGGIDGKGWPFGRDVVISEIYRLIEETEGVDYTISAQLIPAQQYVNLCFSPREFSQPFPAGSYVETRDGATRFPLVEMSTGKNDSFRVKGFKQGDWIVISHRDDLYLRKCVKIKSIDENNWKLLRFEPFRIDKTFPKGSVVTTEDGSVRSTLSPGVYANKKIEEFQIAGFSQGDVVNVKKITTGEDGDLLVGNIELTAVERCTDRVYLGENQLPWYCF